MDSIRIPEKTFFKIGEVAKLLALESYVLRYWETEFEQLTPQKTRSGQRSYQRHDIELLIAIKYLLYDEMFTIAGARQRLKAMREGGLSPSDLVSGREKAGPVNEDGTKAKLKSATDRVEELEVIVGALKRDRLELRDALAAARANAAQTDLLSLNGGEPDESQVAKLEELQAEVELLRAENGAMRAAIESKSRYVAPEVFESMQAEMAALKARESTLVSQLEASRDGTDEALNSLNVELLAGHERIAQLESALETRSSFVAPEEFAALEEELAVATQLNADLMSELERRSAFVAPEELEAVHAELESALAEKLELRGHLEQIESEQISPELVEELHEAIADLELEKSALEATLSRVEAELISPEDFESVRQQLATLSGENVLLEQRLVEAEASSLSEEELDRLRERVASLNIENESLRGMIDERARGRRETFANLRRELETLGHLAEAVH